MPVKRTTVRIRRFPKRTLYTMSIEDFLANFEPLNMSTEEFLSQAKPLIWGKAADGSVWAGEVSDE